MAANWGVAFASCPAQLFSELLLLRRPPVHRLWWCIGTPWCFTAAERAYDPAAAPRRHAIQQLDQGPASG